MRSNRDACTTPLSVTLSMSISASADWRKLIAESASAMSQFFIKDPADAVAGGTTALLNFFTSFKLSRSPGYLLWALTLNATAWSINNSLELDNQNVKNIVDATKNFLNSEGKKYKESGLNVPVDFFNRPTRLGLYHEYRDYLLRKLNLTEVERSLARIKIDSAFPIAIFELMSRRSEFYAPIPTALNIEGFQAASVARSWEAYKAKLIYDFEVKEVFGQEGNKISLSQLYVPLRGVWKEPTEGQ